MHKYSPVQCQCDPTIGRPEILQRNRSSQRHQRQRGEPTEPLVYALIQNPIRAEPEQCVPEGCPCETPLRGVSGLQLASVDGSSPKHAAVQPPQTILLRKDL